MALRSRVDWRVHSTLSIHPVAQPGPPHGDPCRTRMSDPHSPVTRLFAGNPAQDGFEVLDPGRERVRFHFTTQIKILRRMAIESRPLAPIVKIRVGGLNELGPVTPHLAA